LLIRPSSEWSAPAGLAKAGHPMPHPPHGLVILHHTYRPHRNAGEAVSKERKDIRGVDGYHRGKQWGGIGYHFAGFQSGNLYVCRPVERTGAHTVGQNARSIGYVLFIDGDTHRPTEAALETLSDWLQDSLNIGLLAKDFQLRPHSDFCDKSCPGKYVTPLIEGILRGLRP
jgi:N-acetylmuramoyl-L-alanine amidase